MPHETPNEQPQTAWRFKFTQKREPPQKVILPCEIQYQNKKFDP